MPPVQRVLVLIGLGLLFVVWFTYLGRRYARVTQRPRFAIRAGRVQTVEDWKREGLKATRIAQILGYGLIVVGLILAVVEVLGG